MVGPLYNTDHYKISRYEENITSLVHILYSYNEQTSEIHCSCLASSLNEEDKQKQGNYNEIGFISFTFNKERKLCFLSFS